MVKVIKPLRERGFVYERSQEVIITNFALWANGKRAIILDGWKSKEKPDEYYYNIEILDRVMHFNGEVEIPGKKITVKDWHISDKESVDFINSIRHLPYDEFSKRLAEFQKNRRTYQEEE